MRSQHTLLSASLVCSLAALGALPHITAAATDDPPAATALTDPPRIREIWVPYKDLGALLESQPQRVLLSRAEYTDLLRRAERTPSAAIPYGVMPIAADYLATVADERAEIVGTLVFEVLAPGLHVVDLDLAGVGLRRASLDQQAAPLGRSERGTLQVFLSGIGRHELTLDLVASVPTTAALQTLQFQGPTMPATRMRVRVPGNVEVKGGAPVVRRTFYPAAQVTEFEILPPPGPLALSMTLNNRLQQSQRVVLARSVLLDEVTAAGERLHATVSMSIPQQPVDRFRLALPAGIELTGVETPLLAQWAVTSDGPQRILEVRLREPTGGTVVLAITGVRTPVDLVNWSFPRLEPLDVLGDTAIVGVLLEEQLKVRQLQASRLMPIDVAVLSTALPARPLEAGAGKQALRPVAAFYAPAGAAALELHARFERPATGLRVASTLGLTLTEGELQLQGGFSLRPEIDKLFAAELELPAEWHVTRVLDAKNRPLPFEPLPAPGPDRARMRVLLPQGVAPGEDAILYVYAVSTPAGWLTDWQTTLAHFPVITVQGAVVAKSVLTVQAREDLVVYADVLEGLLPLDEKEKPQYGLAAGSAPGEALCYSFGAPTYRATFRVERVAPRATARSYAFLRLAPDVLTAHYELVYQVTEARARQLAFELPASTPADITIRGLDGVRLKEYEGKVAGDVRCWTVLLSEPRRDTVRLAVDFEQRSGDADAFDLALPLARAIGVVYQSGVVAVQGSEDLEVTVLRHPRRVDVGELAPADFQPTGTAMGGLGVFGFVGDEGAVEVHVARRAGYKLPVAIVQHAELISTLSADGICQTAAVLQLRLKTDFLEIELPAGATLWSAAVDGKPAQPQRESGRLLLSVGGSAAMLRELRIVYELPVGTAGFWRDVDVPALRLWVPGETPQAKPSEVPIADLAWQLNLPGGYRAVRQGGTVRSAEVQPPEPAARTVAKTLYEMAGGVHFLYDGLLPSFTRAREVKEWRLGRVERGAAPSRTRAREVKVQLGGAVPESTAGFDSDDRLFFDVRENSDEIPGTEAARDDKSPRDGEDFKSNTTLGQALACYGTVGESAKSVETSLWGLEGVRSLKIDVEATGRVLRFASLGGEPRLRVTLAAWQGVEALTWALVLLVALIGLALINRRRRAKAAWIVLVALTTTLVPLVSGRPELAHITNAAFFTACLLLPGYLLVSFLRWVCRKAQRSACKPASTATLALLACGLLVSTARAEDPGKAPPPHLKVPADAIIVPYDPKLSITPTQPGAGFDRLLVPYDRFMELWNQVYPEKRIEAVPPPAAYALAGASYTARLGDEDSLNLEGQIDIEVFVAGQVAIPLCLEGGVLTRATLDGVSAPLTLVQEHPNAPAPPQAPTAQPQTTTPQTASVLLGVQGLGKHRLDIAVRLHVTRLGGWRTVRGVVPAAPASALALRIPLGGTELRLGSVVDRRSYETQQVDETIATTLGLNGAVEVQWRPKVQEGRVDPTLTASSAALFDVCEDGLHLAWKLDLDLGRMERDGFTLVVPADYLVEAVEGPNIRGWTQRPAAGTETAEGRQSVTEQIIEVTLLRAARGAEGCTIVLSRRGPVTDGELTPLDVPVVRVVEAAQHSGVLTIRRSPRLELQTEQAPGLTRADTPADLAEPLPLVRESLLAPPPPGLTRADAPAELATFAGKDAGGPLGVRPYQTYRFAATPFVLRLAVSRPATRPEASVQTVLRVAERQRNLESRITIRPAGVPEYQVRVVLPDGLRLEQVTAPSACEWAVIETEGRQVLHVYLATGQTHPFPLVIRGPLGTTETVESLNLPRLEVLGAARQTGEIVVQVDPAFDLRPADLRNCRDLDLKNVLAWLTAEQRPLARLALEYHTPDYSGILRLAARTPQVTCSTITNVRVTETAIEETILLDFDITHAGLRTIAFVVPAWMKDARITVPMLREKQVAAISTEADSPLRVTLTLQDEVIGRLRVLVENDRVRTGGTQTTPIPIVETGETRRRLIALENIGRDEVEVVAVQGVEPLSAHQAEWKALADYLAGKIGQAYVVIGATPQMTYQTRERIAVETAGARIGLAQTVLVLDNAGTYRAAQSYRVDNTTEAFLEVELPDGAALLSTLVAGQPVKPAPVPDGKKPRNVRIPLLKTAAGDLDYVVSLHYGGYLPEPGLFATMGFPIPRTVNIAVELSQVRLHLPEDYHWIDFGGTTGQIFDEADLAAGQLRSQTRLAERLTQALQSGSRFTQVRAATNLETLKDQSAKLGEYASTLVGNDSLRQELAFNEMAVQQAEVQAQQVAPAAQHSSSASSDNRRRLNDVFDAQQTMRARNTVQSLESNWTETPPAEDSSVRSAGKATGKGDEGRKPAKDETGPESRVSGRDSRRGPAQPQTEELYQQKLTARHQEQQQAYMYDEVGLERKQPARVEPRVPLASLPIEIPVRGKVFYFATPRGDVTITARALSHPAANALEQAGIVVLMIGLGAFGWRAARAARRTSAAQPGRGIGALGPTVLILIGVLSVVTGILPIAGLAAAITGFVLHRRRRLAVAVPAASEGTC